MDFDDTASICAYDIIKFAHFKLDQSHAHNFLTGWERVVLNVLLASKGNIYSSKTLKNQHNGQKSVFCRLVVLARDETPFFQTI